MEILEEVATDDAADAERFYCEYLEPTLNKCVPGRSHAEYVKAWQQKNKEKCKEKALRWYYKNKAKRE
jgi:hypothetical protein